MMKITQKIKIYFSSPLFGFGFLTNLGLVTITYLIYLIAINNVTLSVLWGLNIFSIIYLLLYFLIEKDVRKMDNNFFMLGFVLSAIIIVLVIIISYIRIFLNILA